MLRRISEPLALSEASVLALRPALNAPVLNVEFLPVGPARAAIVVFAEEYGGVGLAVGIRSTEGGQVVVFKNRESIDESVPLAEVLEPALSSAERMGFLFDEDMVEATPGGRGRGEATALWGRLMGDVAMPPPPKAAPPLPAATEPILDLTETMSAAADDAELILEEVAPASAGLGGEDLSLDAGQTTATEELELEVDDPTPVPPAATLSKFRQVDAPPAQSPKRAKSKSVAKPKKRAQAVDPNGTSGDGAPNLGRVPLVRVRRGGDSPKRIPYLARLLSSF